MPLLIFLVYPICEIILWWKFISLFGFLDALLWCVLSAIVGFYILKLQSRGAVEDFQRAAASGQMPSRRVVHRILMSFGGFLLILPGVMTDLMGAVLVLPGLRHMLVFLIYWKMAGALVKGFGRAGPMGSFMFTFSSGVRNTRTNQPGGPSVIDVEARVIEDDQPQLSTRDANHSKKE